MANYHLEHPLGGPKHIGNLIGYLTKPPIMAYPYYEKSAIVHKDTLKDGLEAVLYHR